MRLICPNCDAEYEVDDAAIPDVGRDVQCSNCGHAWFQEAAGAAAFVSTSPDEPAHSEDAVDADADLAQPAVVPAGALQPRTVDDSVLAILKEETERELSARRAETAVPVETQPDLGLDTADAAAQAQHAARLKAEEAAAERARNVTRRELLPDIEEINSTLRPSVAMQDDDDDDDAHRMARPQPQARSGFQSGFVLMLVLAAVLVALYLMAPRLAQQIPGAKGALEVYVASVDQARIGLDSATKWVIGALRRQAGSE
jgi:predicted Zn finger-like uncharacterized protein